MILTHSRGTLIACSYLGGCELAGCGMGVETLCWDSYKEGRGACSPELCELCKSHSPALYVNWRKLVNYAM